MSAEPKRVSVVIDPETIISYQITNKDTKISTYKGKLTCITKLSIPFKEGFDVTIGNNKYVLVKDFFSDPKTIPYLESVERLFRLVFDYVVKMENDIPVKLTQDLNIELPYDFNITLDVGTRLQQRDSDIRLTLEKEKTIRVIDPCPKETMPESDTAKD